MCNRFQTFRGVQEVGDVCKGGERTLKEGSEKRSLRGKYEFAFLSNGASWLHHLRSVTFRSRRMNRG